MNEVLPFQQKQKPKLPSGPTGHEPITAKNYDQRALAFARASGLSEFPTITPGTPEWTAWERYFDMHLRWRPWVFKAIVSGQKAMMTVPTQWPEWFDSSFVGSD